MMGSCAGYERLSEGWNASAVWEFFPYAKGVKAGLQQRKSGVQKAKGRDPERGAAEQPIK